MASMKIFGEAPTEGVSSLQKEAMHGVLLQPETRPISQEQLVAEVKGIYAGLVMVEAKCIEVDNKQAMAHQSDPEGQPKLNNEQWQALIALHRTLLHEHHDFFLASQHPSASPALRRLASKYAMPARMWRHGIHSFLELLRHRLPASLDHMLAFVYLAYSMMARLYETVPAFEDTWIECLGDLVRYRNAIEDDDARDREVWTGVARHWYMKASDKSPATGRLYHHLDILSRPNALQQLFYYAKCLCVEHPFVSARESILTLFDPVINAGIGHGRYRLSTLDGAFVRAHSLLFRAKRMNNFDDGVSEDLGLHDNHINRVAREFMEQSYHIAIANCIEFASKENILLRRITFTEDGEDPQMEGASLDHSLPSFTRALYLSNATLEVVLRRIGDPNDLSFVHAALFFMYSWHQHTNAWERLDSRFPWRLLATMLNTLIYSCQTKVGRNESLEFSVPKNDIHPLPEDFLLRGLLWAGRYLSDTWIENPSTGFEDKRMWLELLSTTSQRKESVLWLALQMSKKGPQISCDSKDWYYHLHNHPNTWNTMNQDSETISNCETKVTKIRKSGQKMKGFFDQLKSSLSGLSFSTYFTRLRVGH